MPLVNLEAALQTNTAVYQKPQSFASLANRHAWFLALLIVVVPNLIIILAMPFFVAVRPISPLLYLGAGLAALRLRPVFAYALFFAAAAADLAMIVAIAFHLPFGLALESVRYMASLNVTQSLFYIMTVALFAFSAFSSGWLVNRHRATLRSAAILPAVIATVSLMQAERQINQHYMKPASPDFQSALSLNHLDSSSIAASQRNLMLVVVEGLGAFEDPDIAKVLTDRLSPAIATGRYDILSGTSNFKGSTTGAEARELCAIWGDHTDFLYGNSQDCLPAQLKRNGYEAIAYHGFSSDMFARNIWYPRVGFGETHFMEDLAGKKGAFTERCGSVFTGLCDVEVGRAAGDRLKQDPNKPKLVYWLTLNSHIPYAPKADGSFGCGTGTAVIANKRVCELTEIWADVFDTVAVIANDPDLPPTDIMIVGDHSTPLWERSAARHFQLGKVQWHLLRWKPAA